MKTTDKQVMVTVTNVPIPSGKSAYAVTKSESGESITFSLTSQIWKYEGNPVIGELLELSDMVKCRNGRRAMSVRRP